MLKIFFIVWAQVCLVREAASKKYQHDMTQWPVCVHTVRQTVMLQKFLLRVYIWNIVVKTTDGTEFSEYYFVN